MDTVLLDSPEARRAALAILEECVDLREFGRRVLEELVNGAMSAGADRACGAEYGACSPGRTNSRNGYRVRGLKTPAGELRLRIPKLRTGTFFPGDVIERWCRADRALVSTVAEMYVAGVSTRKVERVAARLGLKSLPRSVASRMAATLDGEVAKFRSRRLDGERFAYLWLDATYVSCRAGGRAVSQAVVTAIGLDETGHKRLLGIDCVDAESHAGWRAFLAGLRDRGVSGVQLVTSDAHAGLVAAIGEVFQGAAWQRCVVHLMRDVSSHIHRAADGEAARRMLGAAFAQRSPLLVRACYQEATERILGMSRAAGEALLEAEGPALAYLDFPATHRAKIRTNNVQERANREIKRRTRVVQSFPSRESVIRLVGAALIEAEEGWSERCLISRASLGFAWRERGEEKPDASAVADARATAGRIMGEVVEGRG